MKLTPRGAAQLFTENIAPLKLSNAQGNHGLFAQTPLLATVERLRF